MLSHVFRFSRLYTIFIFTKFAKPQKLGEKNAKISDVNFLYMEQPKCGVIGVEGQF